MGGLTTKKKILDAEKIRIIGLQADLVKKKGFFLAGGTAMGLLLKLRISRDLDWFTAQAFDAEALKKELSALGEKPTSIAQNSAHTVRAYYGNFETSSRLAHHTCYEAIHKSPTAATGWRVRFAPPW